MRISSLLLALALFHSTAALAAPADRFFSDGYSYCDAHLLAGYWSIGTYEAKVRAGEKIEAGYKSTLEEALGEARTQAPMNGVHCTFAMTDFTYDDAMRLASVWGMDIAEVKAKLVTKTMAGNVSGARAALASAPSPGSMYQEVSADDSSYMARFFASDHTYCDATILASAWSESVHEAKVDIGRKLTHGIPVGETLSLARGTAQSNGVQCHYHESEFTYDDAVLLAAAWGVEPLEAKSRVENKLFWGSSGMVKAELARLRRG